MLVRGWTSWRTSGSSSRGLAVISSMRTEDSNAIRLESWVEGSICGSVLAQKRGRDSTGSQTRLYSKVWATRVFKGSRHRTLPVTTPQTHTHTHPKNTRTRYFSRFFFSSGWCGVSNRTLTDADAPEFTPESHVRFMWSCSGREEWKVEETRGEGRRREERGRRLDERRGEETKLLTHFVALKVSNPL